MAIGIAAGIWLKIVLTLQQVAGHLQERNWQFSKEFRDEFAAGILPCGRFAGGFTSPS
jgi:hypothetical protein